MAAANQDRGAGTRRESFWLSPCSTAFSPPPPTPQGGGASPRREQQGPPCPATPPRACRPRLGNSPPGSPPTARPQPAPPTRRGFFHFFFATRFWRACFAASAKRQAAVC